MIDYFGDYETLVAEAGKWHGSICAGIKIGTRMTMSGLRRIDIADPRGEDRKRLMVIAEIDRCCTDAIMALTGCRPGKRSMKIRYYGKMAATFINLDTMKAVRVATLPRAKRPDGSEADEPDVATAPEEALFSIMEVHVPLRPEDLPGKPLCRIPCAVCGESILDGMEHVLGGVSRCTPCHEKKAYYFPL